MSSCEVCARKGLLIYPVRYAVTCPAGAAGVPGLSGNFKIEGAPSDIGKAKYTLRSMRAGYLYAYDEKRKRLKAYMVVPQGLLWNFPVEHLPPPPAAAVFSCVNPADMAYARCVDIAHSAADPATNLWIGWSNVAWTKELIAKVDDAAWRKKHMQCVNVPAMLAGGATHTAEFKAHHKQIAHFGVDSAAMVKAFAFSNTPTTDETRQRRLGEQIATTMAAHEPHKKGFIVALNDPVGMTNDLSELTLPTVDAGFDEDIARGKMTYDMLSLVEKSIREDARKNVSVSENIAKMSENNPNGDVYNSSKSLWAVIKAGGLRNYEAKLKAEQKKYGDHQTGRQNAAADQAWAEVSTEEKGGDGRRESVLDEGRRKNFPEVYAAALKEYQPANEKLARSHAAWLTSEQLANWMEGVHDTKDIRSGYAFSESVAQCVGKGVSSEPCSEQLLVWINNGQISDPRNLYARGLLFNHDELIKMTASDLKGSDLQYENILNIYKVALIRFDDGHTSKLMDRLPLATANILVKAIKHSGYSTMRHVAITKLKLLGSGRIVTMNTHSAADVSKWMFEQAKAHRINLNESDTKSKNAAYKHADEAVRANPPKSGLVAYEIDTAQLEREGLIREGTIKSVRVPGFDKTKEWLGSAAPREFHLGVVTTIIQLIALGFVMQDFINDDPFNQWERRTKGIAAVVGLTATIVDMAAATVARTPSHPIAAFLPSQWAVDVNRAKTVSKIAQKIGLAAGVVTAGYDIFINAVIAYNNDKGVLAGLYFINGALGVAVAVTAYMTMAIFWPLLILSFIVGIIIATISSSALQDWMSRCYFSDGVTKVRAVTNGKQPYQTYPYPTANDEFKAYKSAIGI
jgi:hypothetical protein